MSKIGKRPITIPDGVEVKIEKENLIFRGPAGSLTFRIPLFIKAEVKDKKIFFNKENDIKQTRANWGTIRSLAQNAVTGVKSGFEKNLELEGVGYRVTMEGETLVLNIGYSHPIRFNPPEGIKISIAKNTIKVSGIDKNLAGRTAAQIKARKPVEPYKGKGIHYTGEYVRRKAGKKVASAAK
ncbi:50S ribosomal protein L6 [Candidatus Wolfebacteria bacterium]|nr:50S ribosomal protein L6 [Candidatus Wolfebacteria bacterium]